jgi:hypothetical protein
MKFIQCNECDTIIAIKDLQEPFTPEILDRATAENTVHGDDLCDTCAARHEAERKEAEEAAAQTAEQEAQELEDSEEN